VSAYPLISGWRAVAERIESQGAGDEWLRVAGVKAFTDGSLGSTTAWFDEPYDDEPTHSGLVTTPLDSLARWMRDADAAGLQLAIHAIGDRANAWLLDTFAGLAATNGARDRRPRVEHAQHLRRADIGRFAELGVIASMQPYHAADDGRWAEKRIGPERIRTTYAFRSLLDADARVAFGSDWSVAPMDPLLGIHAAVTRRTIDGANPGGWVPQERITVEEALRAYTSEGAHAVFAEGRRGTIRPGYDADLVVLDRDLTRVAPEALDQARVRRTIVGGRTVFAEP
jgi:predicted amidohydrolase YtcJ